MGILRRLICNHDYRVIDKSNVVLPLPYGDTALLLCMVKCAKCGKVKQEWIDINLEKAIADLDAGDLVLMEWKGDKNG